MNKDTCQGNKFVQHKTNLCEDYHTFRLDWDVQAHTAKYYIDGVCLLLEQAALLTACPLLRVHPLLLIVHVLIGQPCRCTSLPSKARQ